MRRFTIYSTLLLSLISTIVFGQITAIPDPNFEQALIDLGIDSAGILDGSVLTSDINTVTNLNVNNKAILDLTGIEDFTALSVLRCRDNYLTSLNLSQNTNLTSLRCYNNNLSSLNVKNGNNTNVTAFNATGNPNLNCIQVDDAAYSTANWTNIAPQSYFGEDCSALIYVPDDNFEQALIDLGYDTVLDDYVLNENINTITTLDVSSKNIYDFTGIEAFVAMEDLDVSFNPITQSISFNISNLTALTSLRSQGNQLTSLDVTQNTALTTLWCGGNLLTSLDVSANTALTYLACSNNQLTNLDVNQNTALNQLLCRSNLLTSLDVTNNTALEILFCDDNQLTSLNVKNGNNTNFANFNATNNPYLACIQVDDAAYSSANWTYIDPQSYFGEDCSALTYVPDDNFEQALIDLGYDTVLDDYVLTENINTVTFLDVGNKNIADLTGIEDFVALETLWCYGNLLTSIDISNNLSLTELRCPTNQLAALDVSNNTNLVTLWCYDNLLTSLDVTNNLDLTELRCLDNQLINLDLSANTALTYLACYNNQLTKLNVKNGNNTNVTYFNATSNADLFCIEVDDTAYSTTNWTNIDVQTDFSIDCTSQTYVPDDNFEQALIDLGYDYILDDYVLTENINTITSLSVSNKNISDLTGIEDFVALTFLTCATNQLTALDISNNTALTTLRCYNNQLTSLDVTQNTALTQLWCGSNLLTSLDVTNNTALINLRFTNNQLTNIDLSANTALEILFCNDNQLTNLNVSQNTALIELFCNNNQLTNLDVSQNTALIELVCNDNQLTNLDLSANTALEILFCNDNQLTNLDISQNTALDYLNCINNQLTNLDVSQNTVLTELYSGNNLLTNLDVSYNTSLIKLGSANNQLTNLDISQNTALVYLNCINNQLTSLNAKNGNNINFVLFNATNNPNLTCIEVDDAVWSTANWTSIDPQTSFSEDCGTKIWENGAWTNGTPSITDIAIIRDNYSTTIQAANIEANSLLIDLGYTLTIESGDYLKVENNLTINGNLIIQHEGSFIQNNDAATVTNNGNIQVLKNMTSFDAGTDFALLGSPMTGETRDGVYNQNNVTMNHLTGNFIPHPDVETDDPTAENFADDNGDNWQFLTGTENIIPGLGYLVGGVTGGGAFTSTYTQGTLNNGMIDFTVTYNGNQNASPNILSNPYASAIDADVFINNNSIVDALYFWEHLTPPSNSYPGYRSENWDMGDISMYNLSGGIASANGGTAPTQFIPSGQGFAIKANASGIVSFNNSIRVTGPNTGYRNSEDFNRMYVNISNETYALKSNTLIAFTDNATNGIDASYDAKRLATPISIYSTVDNFELAIQGRSAFNEDQIIPLGFRTQVEELQEYTISLGEIEGDLINNATVFLLDNLLQTETNLSENNYSFTSEDGNFNNRFLIYFRQEILGLNELNSNTILLYPNPVSNQLTISSNAIITNVSVFDLSGRKVNTIEANEQTSFTIDLSQLSSAVYLIEVNTHNGSLTKRIIKE